MILRKINKRFLAFFLIILATICNSIATILNKHIINNSIFSIKSFILNPYIYLALFIFFLSYVMVIISIKLVDLSIIYPTLSLSYIWITIIAYFLFNELITFSKVFGMISIILGIIFINLGD
jgi:multidrug transporter EmrE-like cation transporter